MSHSAGCVCSIMWKMPPSGESYTIILIKSVAISKLQVAILARSSREMSQTVRID